jgi:hypothetical protein
MLIKLTRPASCSGKNKIKSKSELQFDVSLGASTVEINQDFSICQDQLLKLAEIILTVETRLFFF